MRWLFIIIASLLIVSCGSTTKTQTSHSIIAKDSIVVKERIVVRQGLNLETVIEQPCDSVGILKPFKQTLKAKDISISLSNEDGSIVAEIESDSLISTNKEVIDRAEVVEVEKEYVEKIKYRTPKLFLWSAIILWVYIIYRVARVFYLPLRILPY